MKISKIKHWLLVALTVSGLPMLVFLLVLLKQSWLPEKQNITYTIATVTNYTKGNRGFTVKGRVTHSSPIVNIKLTHNGIEIETSSKGMGPKEYQKDCIGKQYVVVYDRIDPKKCVLLFDYPVIDSTDFVKYMEEFKINPPNYNRYKKIEFTKKNPLP